MITQRELIEQIEKIGGLLTFDRTKLTGVDLCGCPVTDDLMTNISHQSSVEFVDVSQTGITDRGISVLGALQSLESLYAQHTRVSVVGLTGLQFCPLRQLNLSNCPEIDDRALSVIGRMRTLEKLWLNHTRISDRGLRELRHLNQLIFLALDFTSITNSGLLNLISLTSLLSLGHRGTQVTQEGIIQLQSELPNLAQGLTL